MARFFIFFLSIVNVYAFDSINNIVNEYISKSNITAAQVLISHNSIIVHQQSYGRRGNEFSDIVDENTLFDLASISKVFTATAILKLHDYGVISIDDYLAKYFDEFEIGDKKQITIEMLLRHTSGIRAANYLSDFDYEDVFSRMMRYPLVQPPNSQFIYSDVGFMLLGHLIEKVTGMSLDNFINQEIITPLNLKSTTYKPKVNNIAHTTDEANAGIVHDPRANLLNGAAGHAGVFSNASNLLKLIDEILFCREKILSADTCAQMKIADFSGRGLGVDVDSKYVNALRGDIFNKNGFAHSGYTGTSFYANNDKNLIIIILTNRVFGGDTDESKKYISKLRRVIANEVASLIK